MTWTAETAAPRIVDFDQLTPEEQEALLSRLNRDFPPAVVEEQLACRKRALAHLAESRARIDAATQVYPKVLDAATLQGDAQSLRGMAIVFTAGGDGERLRLSLEEQGADAQALQDFTKATWALPGFGQDFGTLQINLALIARICEETGLQIPVVVTTGPAGSTTARVIPEILARHNHFGLKQLMIVRQDKRLHFTADERIATVRTEEGVKPVTHPDETGGPLMKLRAPQDDGSPSPLSVMAEAGCTKILCLQGTAVYDPQMIFNIAAAAEKYDGIGVGIARTSFPENDPYGTYVGLQEGDRCRIVILEQDVRNDATRQLANADGSRYLPYNTGFYAFDLSVLAEQGLPDYATPPKQIRPDLAPSPKVGYAATDLLPLCAKPAVLTIPDQAFGVLKNAADLPRLADLARQLNLQSVLPKA